MLLHTELICATELRTEPRRTCTDQVQHAGAGPQLERRGRGRSWVGWSEACEQGLPSKPWVNNRIHTHHAAVSVALPRHRGHVGVAAGGSAGVVVRFDPVRQAVEDRLPRVGLGDQLVDRGCQRWEAAVCTDAPGQLWRDGRAVERDCSAAAGDRAAASPRHREAGDDAEVGLDVVEGLVAAKPGLVLPCLGAQRLKCLLEVVVRAYDVGRHAVAANRSAAALVINVVVSTCRGSDEAGQEPSGRGVGAGDGLPAVTHDLEGWQGDRDASGSSEKCPSRKCLDSSHVYSSSPTTRKRNASEAANSMMMSVSRMSWSG